MSVPPSEKLRRGLGVRRVGAVVLFAFAIVLYTVGFGISGKLSSDIKTQAHTNCRRIDVLSHIIADVRPVPAAAALASTARADFIKVASHLSASQEDRALHDLSIVVVSGQSVDVARLTQDEDHFVRLTRDSHHCQP